MGQLCELAREELPSDNDMINQRYVSHLLVFWLGIVEYDFFLGQEKESSSTHRPAKLSPFFQTLLDSLVILKTENANLHLMNILQRCHIYFYFYLVSSF